MNHVRRPVIVPFLCHAAVFLLEHPGVLIGIVMAILLWNI